MSQTVYGMYGVIGHISESLLTELYNLANYGVLFSHSSIKCLYHLTVYMYIIVHGQLCHTCNTCVVFLCVLHVFLHMCRIYTCITHVVLHIVIHV